MKALLLDPDRQRIDYLEFDGNEESIAVLPGHEELDWGTYLPKLRMRNRSHRFQCFRGFGLDFDLLLLAGFFAGFILLDVVLFGEYPRDR